MVGGGDQPQAVGGGVDGQRAGERGLESAGRDQGSHPELGPGCVCDRDRDRQRAASQLYARAAAVQSIHRGPSKHFENDISRVLFMPFIFTAGNQFMWFQNQKVQKAVNVGSLFI